MTYLLCCIMDFIAIAYKRLGLNLLFLSYVSNELKRRF